MSDELRPPSDARQSTAWTKSSFSGDLGCCVEIGFSTKGILVRDSKEAAAGGPVAILSFTEPEWRAFIAGVKAGEFDL